MIEEMKMREANLDLFSKIEQVINTHKHLTNESPTVIFLGLNELIELSNSLYRDVMTKNIGQPLDEVRIFDCKIEAHLSPYHISTSTRIKDIENETSNQQA